MKLTVQELNIIIDALLGSIRIVDSTGLGLFAYTSKAREALAKELIGRADMIWIGIDTDEPN